MSKKIDLLFQSIKQLLESLKCMWHKHRMTSIVSQSYVRQLLQLMLGDFKGIWHWLCLETWHIHISSSVWLFKTIQTCLLFEYANRRYIEV